MKYSFILISKWLLSKNHKKIVLCKLSDKMKLIILFSAGILQAVM